MGTILEAKMDDLTTVPILTKSDCIISLCSSWGKKAYFPLNLLEKLYPYTSYHADKERIRKLLKTPEYEIDLGSWFYYKDPLNKGPVTIVIVSSYKPGQSIEFNSISMDQVSNGKIDPEERKKIEQDTNENRLRYISQALESIKKIDPFKKFNLKTVYTLGWNDTQKSCFPDGEKNVYSVFNDFFKKECIPWNMIISQRNTTDNQLQMIKPGVAPPTEMWSMKNDLVESYEDTSNKKFESKKPNTGIDEENKKRKNKDEGKQPKKNKKVEKTKAVREPQPSTSSLPVLNVDDVINDIFPDLNEIEYEVTTS